MNRKMWERFVQVAYSEGYITESVRDTCLELVSMVWKAEHEMPVKEAA